jgi:hypothetical protein
MEKNKNPAPIFCKFKQMPSGFSDAWSSQEIDHHSSTPILHHSLKLIRAEPNISDLALRAVGSALRPVGPTGWKRSRRPTEPGFGYRIKLQGKTHDAMSQVQLRATRSTY